MLSKKNRISKEDFPSSQVRGLRIFSPLFSGVIYKNDGLTRVAVVVSKKTAKTAVVRNRIRRRFYAALAHFLKDTNKGYLMVFYPKKEAETAPFPVLRSEIEATLRKSL
ncbi:MAG: ribonuclease P protein component [Patescibacteria group bacterium]